MPRANERVAVLCALFLSLSATAAETEVATDPDGRSVTIVAAAFQPRSGNDEIPFTRYDGSLFGLHRDNYFNPRDFYPPFFNGSGVSSGDINRDGWPDVVAASGNLVILYMNDGGKRFNALEMDVTGIEDLALFNVALVDINGDGWLDIFGTTYLQGNFILLNDEGRYTSCLLYTSPSPRDA